MALRRDGWCLACCTRHTRTARCPGDLLATGEERHGWKVRVETPHGLEAYAVLVAEAGHLWRARILTYPRMLWMVPGGGGSLKFVGDTPREAERRAIEFIRAHCAEKEYGILHTEDAFHPDWVDWEGGPLRLGDRDERPAPRKIRFLPVQYGVVGPTEKGRTGNLSATGLFVITDAPVSSGKQLEMLLDLNQDLVPLRGRVMWARNEHHVGRSPGMGVLLDSPPRRYVRYVHSLP
jgi:hypothetical protein